MEDEAQSDKKMNLKRVKSLDPAQVVVHCPVCGQKVYLDGESIVPHMNGFGMTCDGTKKVY